MPGIALIFVGERLERGRGLAVGDSDSQPAAFRRLVPKPSRLVTWTLAVRFFVIIVHLCPNHPLMRALTLIQIKGSGRFHNCDKKSNGRSDLRPNAPRRSVQREEDAASLAWSQAAA